MINLINIIKKLLIASIILISINVNANPVTNTVDIGTYTYDPVITNNTASTTDQICPSYLATILDITLFDQLSNELDPLASNYNINPPYNDTSSLNDPLFVGDIYDVEILVQNASTEILTDFTLEWEAVERANFTARAFDYQNDLTTSVPGSTVNYIEDTVSFNDKFEISNLNIPENGSFTISFSMELNQINTSSSFTQFVYFNPIINLDDGNGCVWNQNDKANFQTWIEFTVEVSADLSIIKASSGGADSSTNATGRFNAGETITYTLSITNNGLAQAAADLVVTDTFPVSSITPIDQGGGNYTTSTNWNCTYISPTITCTNANSLANGASSSIDIQGLVLQN